MQDFFHQPYYDRVIFFEWKRWWFFMFFIPLDGVMSWFSTLWGTLVFKNIPHNPTKAPSLGHVPIAMVSGRSICWSIGKISEVEGFHEATRENTTEHFILIDTKSFLNIQLPKHPCLYIYSNIYIYKYIIICVLVLRSTKSTKNTYFNPPPNFPSLLNKLYGFWNCPNKTSVMNERSTIISFIGWYGVWSNTYQSSFHSLTR